MNNTQPLGPPPGDQSYTRSYVPPQGQPVRPESPFPPIRRKPWWKRWWAVLLFIAVGLLVLSALLKPDPVATTAEPAPTVTVTATETVTAPAEPPATEPTAAPKPEPTKTQAPRGKPLTPAQENAIESAESYLESGALSKKGLVEQLKFEDYSTKDATFAVEYLEKNDLVDWNAEAAESAKSYLDSGSFSRKGLVDQLKYEGFTQKQAEYGVKQAGL